MFARICRWEDVPDASRDVGMQWFTDDYLPVARDMAGFDGALLLVDREGARVTTITFWASDSDLRASEDAVRRMADRNAEAGAPKPVIESFEIAHSELTERARL